MDEERDWGMVSEPPEEDDGPIKSISENVICCENWL